MNTLVHLNRALYLDVNRVARATPWAHGALATYAHLLGVGVLAVCLLVAWWRSRSADDPPRQVAGVLVAAGGTVVAWVLAHYVLKPLIHERRPYLTLPHVEVLLARTHGYSFPSGHATVAGAVIVGLFLAKDRLMAWLATFFGLCLAADRVYVGMHYPGDVLGGLVVGGLVMVILFVPARAVLTRFDRWLLGTPLRPLVRA
jgi:undecaprenyl-diphosphatase